MKIREVELFGLRIPYKQPVKQAFGYRYSGDFLLVRLSTDSGDMGIGGSGVLYPRHSGDTLAGALQVIESDIAPNVLLGESPFNINKINAGMDKLYHGHTMSKSCLDFALYDLVGKILGVPVYDLLGGAQREEIELEWIVMLDTPEKMAEDAQLYLDKGFHGVKIKFDGNPELDLARVKAVRKRIGDKVRLSIDMNMAYSAAQAVRVINALEEYDIKFVEQPGERHDLEGLQRVRRQTRIPLAADESAWSVPECLQLVKLGLVDFLHAAPSRIGGLTKARQYLAIAEAARVPCIYSIYNGPELEYAAACHFAFAAPVKDIPDEIVGTLNLYGGYDSDDIKEPITDKVNPRLKQGKIYKPEGPGFGLELNYDNLNKYLVAHKVITQ